MCKNVKQKPGVPTGINVTAIRELSRRQRKERASMLLYAYIIYVRAPTEEKDDDEKDNFYEDLNQIYEECPKRDVKIIIVDLNAKIGQEEMHRPITGKYSLHTLYNDNGIRLINFACSKNMVLASTLFTHKDIHKMTWRYRDGQTFNQIDHLLIDARHVSNVMDVRTFREATIDSDNYLLKSKIRSRISNARKTYGSYARKFDSEKLKSSETSSAYREKLNEYLARHVDDNDDINEAWTLLKNAITQTASKVLERLDRVTHKDWFNAECEQATISKNNAYKRTQRGNHTRKAVEEYRTDRSAEKRVHKQKKKIFIQRGLEDLERLRSNNESKSFYQKLKKKSRKDFKPRTTLCRNKERTLLSEDDILRNWAEHFDELLNKDFLKSKCH